MSTWIYVTNLPLYYDDIALKDIFKDIGQILATKISKDKLLLKSTAIIQFSHSKHAKLAASKKDNSIMDKSAIRVFIIWCHKEDLSTLKVTNILPNSNIQDLEKYFNPYGDIVHIEIIPSNNNIPPSTPYALISFSRVDYALQASQEMNDTIIALNHQLCVTLMNPDARNLQWKRHAFEYIALNNNRPYNTHITHENDDTLYSKENEIIISETPLPLSPLHNKCSTYSTLSSLSSPTCTKSIPSSDISSNDDCDDDGDCEEADLIVYGYIRPLQIDYTLLHKICNITLFYFQIDNSKPLYLRDPSIPAPPQRIPPSPPLEITPKTVQNDVQNMVPDRIKITEEKVAISISEIEGKYQQIFDIYRDRLDVIETRMTVLKSEFETISIGMNRTLVGLEHRRINDINTIQKQFNSTITALCYQINNQINNQILKITQKMETSRLENQARINELENKISQLKNENNMLRKQNKIHKILKIKGVNVNVNVNGEVWSEEEKLKNWLFETVKLPQYLSVLVNNGYDDLESMHDITFNELQTVGINKMGHRKKLIKYAGMLGVSNGGGVNVKGKYNGKMSPNSANSSLLYTAHNIWSDDSVSSMPWNGGAGCYQLSSHSQGSSHHSHHSQSRGDKTQMEGT